MILIRKKYRSGYSFLKSKEGITLVELMIAMGVGGIVLLAIYSSYYTQTLMNRKQTVVLNMQQNIRGGLYLMERDIRMAGYDINDTGNFGITDIRFRNIGGNPDLNGNSAIMFTADFDDDGILDMNETVSFSIIDYPITVPDGTLDLGRAVGGGGRQLIAESIEALFMAYAYDNDGDGLLDTSGGDIIWAIDSNNDNILDEDVDTGASIGGSGVTVDKIKAVKIWLLARTKTPILKYTDNNSYNVGNRVITPNDDYKRELLVTTIKCRNLGM